MKWLDAMLERPRSVLTMMVVMVLAGLYGYLTIPREDKPDIDVPVFYVSIPYEGISPEDGVRLLVKPMETELSGLDGLKQITAIASQSHASIIVEFNSDVDVDEAGRDVREKVDNARAKLPRDAEKPTVHEINFSLTPSIAVVVSGDVPERVLYRHARRLKDHLEAIPSVLEAQMSGHREELLEVIIGRARLESYQLSPAQIAAAVSRNNRLVAAGFMDGGKKGGGRVDIKLPGLCEKTSDVLSLPVIKRDGRVVTLGDVASVRRTFKDRSSYLRFNGRPAIGINVVKRLGANIVANNLAVRRAVAEFTSNWPAAIHADLALDRSRTVDENLASLQSSIISAIALVMIVVVAALGLRSSLLVGLSIPVSFLVSFLVLVLAGHTLNMMHMFGMALTVGILVDAAIVIVEYADRKIAEGLERAEAYKMAARRMFWPIASSTATTLAAFLPMAMWPGVVGKFMSFLPLTVIFVLSASLLTAMVFLPALGGLMGRRKVPAHEAATALQLAGGGHVDYNEIRGLAGVYVRLLARLIRHPLLVLAASLVLIAAVFMLYRLAHPASQLFVDTEPEQAFVFVSARGNLSAREKLDLVRKVEREVLETGGIRAVFTQVGQIGGNVIDGGGQDRPLDMIGQIIIEPADYNLRRKGKLILDEIRRRAANIAGVKVEVRKREEGPPTGKDIRLQISGDDRLQVERTARLIRRHFETGVKDLRDIEDSTPLPGIEWQLLIDRREAGRFGADIASAGDLVQLAAGGLLIGKWRPEDAEDEMDIRLRLPRSERHLDQLGNLRVMTSQGLQPLANFVKRVPRPRVSSITRRDGRYMMMVKANVSGGASPNDRIAEIKEWLGKQSWPQGITMRFRGADEEQQKSRAFLTRAMAGALFLMFLILVTQFNSFYQTAITLSTVLLSVVGVMIGIIVTGQEFSIIMTGTGIVALAGIVVNNSIVLIDTYNHFRRDLGMEAVDAALRSSAQRLRPVLLTTITTMCGLAPMALQLNLDFFHRQISIGSITSVWWVQLSTAIIFGLGFATILTLILTPTLLAMPSVLGASLGRLRLPRWRKTPAPARQS